MSVCELESQLVAAQSAGRRPFLVVATAGTTVLGAFDDIDGIADVCQKHAVWLHVDVGLRTIDTHTHTHTHTRLTALCPGLPR